MKRLSSRHHPLVTACRNLARGRDPLRLLLDGLHLVDEALQAGIQVETAVFTDRLLATADGRRVASELGRRGTQVVEALETVIQAMSPVASPSGVVALARRPPDTVDRALANPPQLVIVAADVQDPGNVGAVVRSAEAGGATGVLLTGISADPFGWRALRGSMGSALRLPVATVAEPAAAVAAARRAGLRVIATIPRGGATPADIDLARPSAVLLGGEGPGLPSSIVDAADERLSVPMQAPVESLNVAVTAALVVYEARRQRLRGTPARSARDHDDA